MDDFLFAEKHNKLSEFLTPEVISEIAKAEHDNDLKQKVDVLFGRAMPAQPPQPPEHLSQLARIKSFLGENSRLYGFLRSAKKRLFEARHREPPARDLAILDPRYEDAVAGILDYQRPYVAPFSEAGWKTVFTSATGLRSSTCLTFGFGLGCRS